MGTIETATTRDVPKPFLKWAGGKSRLIPQYESLLPRTYQTYFEPFLGGGALFFHLHPSPAALSDINPELVNCYQCVQQQVEALILLLETHNLNHGHDYYYEIRGQQFKDPVKRAARFIYLNKTCFNGLYRENLQGQFNVPIGRYKRPKICDPSLLRTVSATLETVELTPQPFTAVLEVAQADDFVYFDPPYHPLSPTSDFTAYSKGTFNQQDQELLREVFSTLAQRGVKVMLSNSDCEFVRSLYSGFNIYTITANRAINSNPQKRGKITEVLVTSY